MKTLKFIVRIVEQVLKTLAYEWVVDITHIIKRLIKAVKAYCALRKLPHAKQLEVTNQCAKFDNPAYHRPDPCIYDQYYLLSLGLAVSRSRSQGRGCRVRRPGLGFRRRSLHSRGDRFRGRLAEDYGSTGRARV